MDDSDASKLEELTISSKKESFVGDLLDCMLFWREKHVPFRKRKLTKDLFLYAQQKNELTDKQVDILTKIADQDAYYIKRAHRSIVLKGLTYLVCRKKKNAERFEDYQRNRSDLSDFARCLDESGNVSRDFLSLFSVDDGGVLYFGIYHLNEIIKVYTDQVEEVQREAVRRLNNNTSLQLSNLDFVRYVYTPEAPDIRIECRTKLYA